MSLKIVNTTGRGRDTKIIDTTSGKDITRSLGAYKIALKASVDNVVRVIIYCRKTEVDLIANLEKFFVDPSVDFNPHTGVTTIQDKNVVGNTTSKPEEERETDND